MDKKYQIGFNQETFDSIEEYRQINHFNSVAEAIRDLLVKGMWLDETLSNPKTKLIVEEDGERQIVKKLMR